MLSPSPKPKILPLVAKSPEKQKLNFSCNALFHMKTRVCLKYFANDVLWKQCLTSKRPRDPFKPNDAHMEELVLY